MAKNLILWLVIAVVLMSVFQSFNGGEQIDRQTSYSQFVKDARNGSIQEVAIESTSGTITGTKNNGERFQTIMPIYDKDILNDLLKSDVNVKGVKPEEQSFLASIFISWFPMILLIGVWIFFMRQMQGGGGKGAMSFGKSKARLMSEDQIKTTFADVAGCDEAKEDVTELVDFLRDPSKFQKLGGSIPKGVLMVGPPGTGKTLLAKAVAGEAKVPFFTISGSDFVEMFVGVGASRVRDMFEQAKKAAPCIIFIDEIDAMGRARGSSDSSGARESDATLNALLTELDGFDARAGIFIIAATNRAEILDPALTRPGRIDRKITLTLPDIKARAEILAVHCRDKTLAQDVDLHAIAATVFQTSGADLENLVNEAALAAGRDGRKVISMSDFTSARDRLLLPQSGGSINLLEDERHLTAVHEAVSYTHLTLPTICSV